MSEFQLPTKKEEITLELMERILSLSGIKHESKNQLIVVSNPDQYDISLRFRWNNTMQGMYVDQGYIVKRPSKDSQLIPAFAIDIDMKEINKQQIQKWLDGINVADYLMKTVTSLKFKY